MRAEQGMMIGVGLLGLFAAYKLVTSKKADETPQPTLIPGLGTPDRPDGNGLLMLGDPLNLKQKQYYRARMVLLGRTAFPFTNSATEEVIGKALASMGFEDVRVFMTISDLPQNWPASTTTAPLSGVRWFEGRWAGPSISLPRPVTIEAMWPTPPPVNAAPTVSGLLEWGQMTG